MSSPRRLQWFLEKLNTKLPRDRAIPLLVIYTDKTRVVTVGIELIQPETSQLRRENQQDLGWWTGKERRVEVPKVILSFLVWVSNGCR